jgi:hypothetical protein
VLLLAAGAAMLAPPPGAAQAGTHPVPDAYTNWSPEDKQAMRNFIRGYVSGDERYAYKVAGGTAQNYYPERAAAIVDRELAARGGQYGFAASRHSVVAQRAGVLPRFGSALSAARKFAPRALGVAGGIYLLWEIQDSFTGKKVRAVVQTINYAPASMITAAEWFFQPSGWCLNATAGPVSYTSGCNGPAVSTPRTFLLGVKVEGYEAASPMYLSIDHCATNSGTEFAWSVPGASNGPVEQFDGLKQARSPYYGGSWRDTHDPALNPLMGCRKALEPPGSHALPLHYIWVTGTSTYYATQDDWEARFFPKRDGLPDGFTDQTGTSSGGTNAKSKIIDTAPTPPANADALIDQELEKPANQPLVDAVGEILGGLPGAPDSCWQTSSCDPLVEFPPPPVSSFTMPNLRGLSQAAVAAALTAAGHTGPLNAVVLQPDQADLTVPPGGAVVTIPEQGATVTLTAPIEVRFNPGPDAMPRLVPEPHPREKYGDYRSRLLDLGWPDEQISRVTLPPELADPELGPAEVQKITPNPGGGHPPDTPIIVTTTPDDWPEPGDGSAACTRPTIRDFDLPKISGIPNTFPFGIPLWIGDALGGFSGAGTAPSFDIPMPGGVDDLHVDLAWTQGILDVTRPVILICAAIGMLVSLINLLGAFWIDQQARRAAGA